MTPRIPILQTGRCVRTAIEPPTVARLPYFLGSLSIQTRSAHILAQLSDNRGAYQKRIRLGRGPSSDKGKTSGRGQKGQKAHGKVHPWFQGGQTPLIRIKGVKGFINLHKLNWTEVNLSTIQDFIDRGRLDAKKQITIKELWDARLVTRLRDGVKLLAGGKHDLRTPIDIMVSRASASAIEAIEAAGGQIVTRYYTKDSMRRLVNGQSLSSKKPLPVGRNHISKVLREMRSQDKYYYRLPDPTGRREIEYYRDPAHRGYLSTKLKEGESPSLFYKIPSKNSDKIITDDGKVKLVRESSKQTNVDRKKLW